MDRAVILAAGRGTRMRAADPSVPLDPEQARLADAGLKALIPVAGHPFLDYTLSTLADAGYREVCLVVGPGDDPIRRHYEGVATGRITLTFAVQEEARGTADAVLAAETFADSAPFLLLNSDNYYSAGVAARLRSVEGPALAGYRRDALLEAGNIPADRIADYAFLEVDASGTLVRIHEKPSPAFLETLSPPLWVSMTCWRFTPSIFEACRAVTPSARGELELPDAVQLALEELGERFTVLPTGDPVLDLSRRADIVSAAAFLDGTQVDL